MKITAYKLFSFFLVFTSIGYAQAIFTESFEGEWIGSPAAPAGWTQTVIAAGDNSPVGSSANDWQKNSWDGSAFNPAGSNAPYCAKKGNSIAYLNTYNCYEGRIVRLESPEIDLSSSIYPEVIFYYHHNDSPNNDQQLKLFYSNNGGSSWSERAVYGFGAGSWERIVEDMGEEYKVTNFKIAFQVTSMNGYDDMWIDNIVIGNFASYTMLDGNYFISNSVTADYSNFTDAINALNTNGVDTDGALFYLKAGDVFIENPPALTATGTEAGQITFKRTTDAGLSNPLVKLEGENSNICISGGDWITFDGIDAAINNDDWSVKYGYLIRNASATDGAQNNTIKNSFIKLDRYNTNSIGILQTASTTLGGGFIPSAAGGANSNNVFHNITIENVYSGIYLLGDASYPDENCEIGIESSGVTTIGASSADDIGNGQDHSWGVKATYQKDIKIFNTEIRNLTVRNTDSARDYGIFLDNASGTSNIYNNKIHDITSYSEYDGSRIYGIRADILTGGTVNIYNNALYGFSHPNLIYGNTELVVKGIAINDETSGGHANLYYNSVRLNITSASSNTVVYCNNGSVEMKNNIFANFSDGHADDSRRLCIVSSDRNYITASSNNILYMKPGTNNFIGATNGYNSLWASIFLWAAEISGDAPTLGKEQGSSNVDPNFTTADNLNFSSSTPADNGGTPISSPSITADINGTARDVTRPTIGAYETSVGQNDNNPPVLSNTSITEGDYPSVSLDVNDNSASASNAKIRLWYRAQGSTGAFTELDADTKPVGMNGTYSWSNSLLGLNSGTYEFYIAVRDDYLTDKNIWMYPIWSTSFVGFDVGETPNYSSNPAVYANVNTFNKTSPSLTDAFHTYQTGDWNVLTNWERFNGTAWEAASDFPTNANGSIIIQNGHTITVTTDVSIDQATIQSGGKVIVNFGTTLTIADGEENDLQVSGTLTNQGNTSGSGNGTITPTGTLIFGDGGIYEHIMAYESAGTIPAATWNTGSTCKVSGYLLGFMNVPSGMDQSFYNFEWNASLDEGGSSYANGSLTTVNGNLTVHQSGHAFTNAFVLSTDTDVTLNIGGNLIIQGEFDLCSGTGTAIVNLKGNLVNNAKLNSSGDNTSLIKFNGTANQNFSSVSGAVSGISNIKFEIDNSEGVTLTSNVIIPDEINFTNGCLNTSTYELQYYLYSPSALVNEHSGSYLVGTLKAVKPVGTGTTEMGGIGVTISAGNDLGDVTVYRRTGSEAVVNGNSIARKWSISSTYAPTDARTITLSWLPDDDNSMDLVNACTWHSTDNGTTWDELNSTHDLSLRTETINVTSFSQFTVSDETHPLPVELSIFAAKANGSSIILNWETQTEIDNYGFEIERRIPLNPPLINLSGIFLTEGDAASAEGDWETIGFVKGNGNSNSPKEYSFFDNEISAGQYSYRLKQIDIDGSFSYSNVVEVNCNMLPSTFALYQNYPNPFNPTTIIKFSIASVETPYMASLQHVTLKIFDVLGSKVAILVNEPKEPGTYEVEFNASQLPSGVYFYRIQAGDPSAGSAQGFIDTKKLVLVK
ncbi:MAG: T9SS type A sorting domain-containing protein [bacterium]